MVSLLCAVAMETVCGMWVYTRKSSLSMEEQPQTMKMNRGRNASVVPLSILPCPLIITPNLKCFSNLWPLDHKKSST